MRRNTVLCIVFAALAVLALAAVAFTESSQGVPASSLDSEMKRRISLIIFFEILVFAAALTAALVLFLKSVLPKLKARHEAKHGTRSAQDRAVGRKAVPVMLFAAFLSIVPSLYGYRFIRRSPGCVLLLICLSVLPLAMLGVSLLIGLRFRRSLNSKKIAELQSMLQEKRENARETAKQTGKKLFRIRLLMYAFAVTLTVCALCVSLLCGALEQYYLIPYAFILFTLGLMRLIPFRTPTAFMYGEKSYVDRRDFPLLYSLAENAERHSGCTETLRIALTADGSIGVAHVDDTVLLILGVYALSVLNEDELTSILRHEFAHVSAEKGDRERVFYNRLTFAKPRHFLSFAESWMYLWPDSVYFSEYELNEFACSVMNEEAADRAMTDGVAKETAASALIKTYYYDKYIFERSMREDRNVYSGEKPQEDEVSSDVELFKESIKARAEFWNGLLMKELPARTASHPTLSKRLDALGVKSCAISPLGGSEEYNAETAKAAKTVDRIVLEDRWKNYRDVRKENYLDPLEKLEQWKKDGEPIAPETYRDIVDAMQTLGLRREADALCERALTVLPGSALPYAYLALGYNALRRYDDRGIELLWKAAKGSNNLLHFALDEIGGYCCATGNAEELERYRREAVTLAQNDIDLYSETGRLRRSDRLSKETLPDGVLEETLAFIRSVENGEIERIYLVRKTVTEDFFTSVFVIKFEKGVKPERSGEIMDRIFEYLDTTTDWQYSLFTYDSVKGAHPERVEGSLVYKK